MTDPEAAAHLHSCLAAAPGSQQITTVLLLTIVAFPPGAGTSQEPLLSVVVSSADRTPRQHQFRWILINIKLDRWLLLLICVSAYAMIADAMIERRNGLCSAFSAPSTSRPKPQHPPRLFFSGNVPNNGCNSGGTHPVRGSWLQVQLLILSFLI